MSSKVKEPVVKLDFGVYQPYALQKEVIDYMDGRKLNPEGNPYRIMVAILGRQSGKSWVARYLSLDGAVNQGMQVMWISTTNKSAKQHWNAITTMLQKSGIPLKRYSQADKEIQFFGGGTLYVRSAHEPDTLRGYTLDRLILDEGAYYRNGGYMWYSVCLPMVTASGGRVFIPTTPKGMNWVFELFNYGQDPNSLIYKSWQQPSWESPYQDKNMLKEIRKTTPKIQFDEEYGAKFISGAGGIFLQAARQMNRSQQLEPAEGEEYYAGVDFGVSEDNVVFTVLRDSGGTIDQVYGERWANSGTLRSLRRLYGLMQKWKPVRTMIETNGVGSTLFSLFREVAAGKDIESLTIMDDFSLDSPEEVEDTGEVKQKNAGELILLNGCKLVGVFMDNPKKREAVETVDLDLEFARLNLISTDEPYGHIQNSEMSTYVRQKTRNSMEITYNAQEGCHDDTVSALYIARMGMPRRAKKASLTAKAPDAPGISFRAARKTFKKQKGFKKHAKRY